MFPWLSSDALNDIPQIVDSESLTLLSPAKCFVGNLAALLVQGDGAEKLLHGQLSANMSSLKPQDSTLACFCNPQGRLHALLFVNRLSNEDFYLVLPKDLLANLQAQLQKYSVFYQVKITPLDNFPCIAFYSTSNGSSAGEIEGNLSIKLNDRLTLIHDSNDQLSQLWQQEDSFIAAKPALWPVITHIEKLPILDAAQAETYLPHHLNALALQALDFNKGCYTGQEIIARMHYRGNIKKHLYRVRFTGSLVEKGTALLHAETKVGEVVNCCPFTNQQHLALAIINDNALTEDIRLDCENQPIIELIDTPPADKA